jgi:hypothetical protein
MSNVQAEELVEYVNLSLDVGHAVDTGDTITM